MGTILRGLPNQTSIKISNKKQQIFDIDKKLKHRVQVGLAQQSTNRDTLRLIQRDNIFTNEQYIEFIKELERRKKVPGCELIIPLPNESKQTYFDSTKGLLDAGVSVGTYTLMMLQGTEFKLPQYRKTFEYIYKNTKYKI